MTQVVGQNNHAEKSGVDNPLIINVIKGFMKQLLR